MKVMKADHERRLEIPGIPGLVRRPVDIDTSTTGFTDLRSLRIYRFDQGADVNGHAEEDEVFLVVLAGTVELKISWEGPDETSIVRTLSAPGDAESTGFVAYLPPHSAYQLTPMTEADVAYARSPPVKGGCARMFASAAPVADGEAMTFIDEPEYAERLRIRCVQISGTMQKTVFSPVGANGAEAETLVHVRTERATGACALLVSKGEPVRLDSWDTVALSRSDFARLEIDGAATILVVSAV